MQVFNLCLKILKKQIPQLIIYVVVYLFVALIMSSSITSEAQKETDLFTRSKNNITLISEEDTPLINGFRQELGKVANFVELPDETEALQDALFFRDILYILRIPSGFTESFMAGENIKLEKTTVPASFNNVYIDLSINKYFNTARLYLQQNNDISQESLVQHISSDLSHETSVELKKINKNPANHIYANYFFNYMSYTLLAIIILGMSSLMIVFFDTDLRRRNFCSPLSLNNVNLQFILANLFFTVIVWFIMVLFCLMFNLNNSININTIYFVINSLIFAFCCASISFLIGNLVKSPNAISAVTNVVTLGMCFISGVFVPIELLGSKVIKIASFTPTYWYVRGNNHVAGLTQFSLDSVKPILTGMLVQLAFTLAFFSVALVIRKKRRFQ